MVEQPDASKSVVRDGEPAEPIDREAVRPSGPAREMQVDSDLSDATRPPAAAHGTRRWPG